MLPSSTPKLSLIEVEKLLSSVEYDRATRPVVVVGIRGYYRDTMGEKGKNDRGIYDDAFFVVSPTHFSAFNGNTDPSVKRQGIATLKPGAYDYRMGNHGISRPGGGYPAFRPATPNEELPVTRDGVSGVTRPGVAINLHKGSRNSTSSEGCQTVPPNQWDAFYAAVTGEMKRHKVKLIKYILIER